MAEREATVVIKWVSDPAEGKAAYDEIRKYAEANPIGLKYATAGGRASETATFSGGGTTPIGGGMPDVAPRRMAPATPGEVGITSAVAGMHGMSGTGFSPATAPVPTATTNTYYGDSTRAFNSNPYEVTNKRIRRLPVIGGPSGDGDDDWKPFEPLHVRQQRWYDNLRERSLAYANRVNRQQIREAHAERPYYEPGGDPRGGFVDPRPVYGPQLPSDDFARRQFGADDFTRSMLRPGSGADVSRGMVRPGTLRTIQAQSAGNAFLRSQLTTFPTLRGQMGSIFGAYGVLSSVESAIAGSNAYALGQAQNLGNYVGAAQAAIESDPDRVFVEGIPLLGGVASQIAESRTGSRAYAARTIGLAGIQDRTSSAIRQQALEIQSSRLSVGVAQAGAAGGLNAQVADINARLAMIEPNRQSQFERDSAPFRERLAAANQTISRFAGQEQLKASDYREYRNAQSDRTSASTELSRAQERSREVAAQQQQALEIQRSVAIRDDARAGLGSLFQTGFSRMAFAASQSGDLAGAVRGGAMAQFLPGILEAQARQRNGDMSEQNAAAIAAGEQGMAQSMASGYTAIRQMQIMAGGSNAAGGLRRSFNPYGAQRAEAAAAFDAAMTRVDANGVVTRISEGSAAGQLAVGQRDNTLANIDQEQRLRNVDLRTGLGFESNAMAARLNRDQVGAGAFELAASGVSRIRDIARAGGDPSLIERAQANTNAGFELTEQSYARSFVGRQIDLQNNLPNFQRDGQDPAEVFGRINAARAQFNEASPTEGKDETALDTQTVNAIGKAVADAMGSLLSK